MPTKTKKKAKLSGKAKTIHIQLLLDESGSMRPNRQAVVDGINEFIGSLKGEKNSERARVGLALFDYRADAPMVRHPRKGKKLDKFKPLTLDDYLPRGSTPLNDAIITTVQQLRKRMSEGDKALMVIFTDGYENASEASAEDAKKALEKAEANGVDVIYLGANVDAVEEGTKLGRQRGQSFNYTSTDKGTRRALRTTASVGASYLADGGTMDANALADKLGDTIDEEE